MVVNAYGCTSTSARVTLFMKDDFPTLGYPHTKIVRVLGSMLGRRDMCCLTCSRYAKDAACFFMMVHILPSAARFSCLHRYKESPYFSSLT